MDFKLSPSDLTFLYDGCQRCFWLKTKMGITQPSIPLPGIFSKMGGLQKTFYSGKRTDMVHPALPPGIVKFGEKWVESNVISFKDHADTIYLKGRFDIVVEFDDGSYGVIDFKTGNPNEQKTDLYSRQLHAYAYCLENPTKKAISLSPITKMGLLYFYPTSTSQTSVNNLSYVSDVHWIEIAKNDANFMQFMERILSLLGNNTPPDPSPGCPWCEYGNKLKRSKLI